MKNRSRKIGTPPGSLQYHGPEVHGKVKITLIEFNEQDYFERDFFDLSECFGHVRENMVKWINVEGVHETSVIESLGKHYKIHPLTLEDIVHVDQRAKFEDYDHYLLSIMKMITYDDAITSEQLSILLTDNTVISFQEPHGGDAFDVIRNRLRQAKGRVRKMGADYLFYALMDAVVDYYFHVLEIIGDKITKVEEEIITDPDEKSLIQLYQLKREVISLRKQIWPMRDMISNLIRTENRFMTESTLLFCRDLQDHITRVIDTIETYRDLLSGIMDIYLSTNSNKMNQVMKVLTIMSSIFIPVTFVAGIYGMNFEYMPELKSHYGYAAVWLVMICVMGGMLLYFKKKKWL